MIRTRWYIVFALLLVIASAGLFLAQFYSFHRPSDTFFYLMQDLAFLPLQLLLVVLIADRYIKKKDRESQIGKINMVIGVFFGEVGDELLSKIVTRTMKRNELYSFLSVSSSWTVRDFHKAVIAANAFSYEIDFADGALDDLRLFLLERRHDILRFLENPNLLEHERFTDLVWAVTHLAEELYHRKTSDDLPPTDIDHLKGDAIRAYRALVVEWIMYMKHLKKHYPYLFSLAVRTNPFNPERTVVVI
ncbi:MAG TPA: hypothetical protein VF857_04050 [Spirochaetota bacterium]